MGSRHRNILDSRFAVPASVSSGKRSRSEYENTDDDARPSANGSGDVEGLR